MSYCQPSDVREALVPEGAIIAGTDTAAAMSDAELAITIGDAQAEVDAALASAPTYYQVPFAGAVPPLAIELTRDIAAYLATLTWRKGSPIPAEHPVFLRNQRAESLLAKLASGQFELPGFGADPDTAAAVVNVVPDEWTWWPNFGFGKGQTQSG